MPDTPQPPTAFSPYARALFMWVGISLCLAAGFARVMPAPWAILVAAAITMPIVAAVFALAPRARRQNAPESAPGMFSKSGRLLSALAMWSGSAVFMWPWLFGPVGDDAACWSALTGIALIPIGVFALLIPHLRADGLSSFHRFLIACFVFVEIATLLLCGNMVILSSGGNPWFFFAATGLVLVFVLSRITWHWLHKQSQGTFSGR
jgi:hypothetical protein